ncbi:YokU family protein [Bacillus songklensis]|uniref:YokU family protein n=1 Tax=Bacillus songklensis TaxID=1069116 RepID=A0ABV8B4U7_9BACI
MECLWCESEGAEPSVNTVYWELPDGSRSIELTNIPCIKCTICGVEYQEEDIIEKIETQLLLINTKQIGQFMDYSEFIKLPRVLKRNYLK